MTGEGHGMSHHPAPHRDRGARWELGLGVAGGPIAWIVQLGVGYAIAASPCYTGPDRNPAGVASWSVVAIYLLCLALALGAGVVALRVFRRTRSEVEGEHGALLDRGHGRTRFVGLWGMLLSFGFSAAILINAIAIVEVPACAL